MNYPYDEHDLMRFLFRLYDTIEVNIRPVIVNDENTEYTTTGIYFGSEAVLRIRGMLEQWQKMKKKYANNEITREAYEDWKANFLDSQKKDYVPFEEGSLKRFNNGMSVKVPPEIKWAQKKHISKRFLDLKVVCFRYIICRMSPVNLNQIFSLNQLSKKVNCSSV